MVGAQQTRLGRMDDSIHQHLRVRRHAIAVGRAGADAQCVEDRGHAGGSHLRVMRDHCGDRVPVALRPWLEVGLDLIRVQFDDAGHEEVAVQVGAGTRRVVGDLGDDPVLDAQRTVDHFVAHDDAGVGEG